MAGKHSQRAHALLSASGSKRWINCPPSARLENKVKSRGSSIYAEEGTLAHEYAELITQRRMMKITDHVFNAELKKIKNNKLYSNEMDDYVIDYCNYVFDIYCESLRNTKDSILESEQKLDFSHYVPEGFGSGDHCIISDGTLHIIDLKYGKGVPVYAEENTQGMLYGLGALKKYEMMYDIHEVVIHIHQPRIGNFSSWSISVNDLYEWADNVLKPAAEIAFSGEGETNPGEWCKFCKVKSMCSKLTEKNIQIAKRDFSDPYLLTESEIVEVYKQIPMLIDWANSVKEYVSEQMQDGKVYPGLKLVRGKSNRKWSDVETVMDVLDSMGYAQSDYQDIKPKGIPAIEKLLGKDQFETLFGDCYIKPEGPLTVVSEDDKRPGVGTQSAIADFSE